MTPAPGRPVPATKIILGVLKTMVIHAVVEYGEHRWSRIRRMDAVAKFLEGFAQEELRLLVVQVLFVIDLEKISADEKTRNINQRYFLCLTISGEILLQLVLHIRLPFFYS